MAHPVTGEVQRLTLARDTLLGLVRAPLYVPALASALPLAMTEAARGRFEPLVGLATALSGGRTGALAEGMHFSVVCAEDVPRLAQAADRPGADFGDAFADIYRRACADWPRGAVPAAFYTLPPAPAATLVLSGGADPVTPPRHGERVARALGAKARHVVVPQAGHGVMGLALPARRRLPLHRRRRRRRGAAGRRRLRARPAAATGLRARHAREGVAMIEVQQLAQALHAGPRRQGAQRAGRGRRELHRRRRPHHRPAGPQRRRQDDHAAHRRGADRRPTPAACAWTASTSPRGPPRRWRAWACSATRAACTRG